MTFPVTSERGQTPHTANLAISGKLNSTGTVTLTASAASTTITNYFISPSSLILFEPLTANAAAELYGNTMYVTAANHGDGTATITHANNAQTDRDFAYVILG